MAFIPIGLDAYVDMHMKSNRDENREAFRARLLAALAAYRQGATCSCGNPIWVIGSAVVGHMCFTCITGEAFPDSDYEIAEALGKPARGKRKRRRGPRHGEHGRS
jgi:hypothetical protein